MTPSQLIDTVSALKPECRGATICTIEKTCRNKPRCADSSTHPIIDFDSIKDEYCSHNGQPSLASVDALAINSSGRNLFLVEIKSWQLAARDYHTGRPVSNEKIANTAEKYVTKLLQKLEDSRTICATLSGIADIFDRTAAAVIFVSDIDIKHNPLATIVTSLNALASLPTDVENFCNSRTAAELGRVTSYPVYYTCCRTFDTDIETYDPIIPNPPTP